MSLSTTQSFDLLITLSKRSRFQVYAFKVNISSLYNLGGYFYWSSWMAGATSPFQPGWWLKHWSHCLKHHSFDGPGAPLASLPNALYQKRSSSLSRPITPPPATPRSSWHGQNRNRNAAKLTSSHIRLRWWCWDSYLTMQHPKLLFFNEIAVGQLYSLLYTQLKHPPQLFKDFLRLLKVRFLCHWTNWDTGDLLAAFDPTKWLVSALSSSCWKMSAITVQQILQLSFSCTEHRPLCLPEASAWTFTVSQCLSSK